MNSLSMDDAERIRGFSANFFFWQGLRWVPFGVALIFWAAALSSWWPFSDAARDLAPFAAMIGAVLVYALIGAYYDRAYGRTEALPKLFTQRSRWKWLVVYPFIFGALVVDGIVQPPFLVSAVVIAGAMIAYVRSTGGGRAHYWVSALVLLGVGVASWFGVAPSGKDGITLLTALLGVIYVVGGVLDHIEMRRRLAATAGAA